MKLRTAYVWVCSLIIWAPALRAQNEKPDGTNSNPRVSSSPAYVKDTVYAQNKTVTPKDTVPVDPNKPIMGGVLTLAGLLAFPQGNFGINTNKTIGYGFDITVLFNLAGRRSRAEWESRWVNLYAGGNFQYVRQDGTSDSYTTDYPLYSSTITSKVRNNMGGIGAVARVEFFPGKVKLFAEAGAGGRFFSGKHQYEVVNTPDNSTGPDDVQTITTNTQLRTDWVGNYSFGGGLRISGEVVGVEFKVLSVQGSKAEYVDMESIKFDRNNETVSYNTKQSQTDMILFQIGISGRF